jgi:hypothetical protein
VAYTRTYRTVVPVAPDADVDLLRWLARESFEQKADGDMLRIISYAESTLRPDQIPPKAAKSLGKPLTDFVFYEFTAQATNEPGE